MSERQEDSRPQSAREILRRLQPDKQDKIALISILLSDENAFTARPRPLGTRGDRALMPKNLKKSDLDSSAITRGVEGHGVSVMAAWAISLQGRIQPFILPKGQMVDSAYSTQQMLAGNCLPQITIAANRHEIWQDRISRNPPFGG